MTIWFTFPSNQAVTFRAAYTALSLEETVGVLVPNVDGTKNLTSSSRISADDAATVVAATPGAQSFTAWPIPGWVDQNIS